VFALTEAARAGVVLQLVAHGFSTGALFILVGGLQARLHTRDLMQMGGLWSNMPQLSGFGLFFAVASLGLPGLANFLAEFLILLGSFPVAPGLTAAATIGLVAAAVYSLALVQRAFHGQGPSGAWADATRVEAAVLGALAALVLWLGVAPQPVLDRVSVTPSLQVTP
jgi:NADH-quinone oxidoreductase subunit M